MKTLPRNVVLMSVLSLVLSACTPTPVAAPSGTGVTTDTTKYVIKYSNGNSAANSQAWRDSVSGWATAVAAASNGRLTVQAFNGGSLCSNAEIYNCLTTDLADMGFTQKNSQPTLYPLQQFSSVTDPDVGTRMNGLYQMKIGRILYDEFPPLIDELSKQNQYGLFITESFGLHIMSSKPINTLDDLKGKRLRTFGTYMPKLVSAAGAAPTTMDAAEVFDALDRKLLDGLISNPFTFRDQRYFETSAKYVTLLGGDVNKGIALPLSGGIGIDMNLAFWNKLPQDLKCVALRASRITELGFAQFAQDDNKSALDLGVKSYGIQVLKMSDADLKRWASLSGNLFTDAAKAADATGGPGTMIVNRYLALTQLSTSEIDDMYTKAWDKRLQQVGCPAS